MMMISDIKESSIQEGKLAYICSPFRMTDNVTIDEHLSYARWICDFTAKVMKITPIAPHLIYPYIWSDQDEKGRALGMECGIEILKNCDCVIVGTMYGLSEGMRHEIEIAEASGIPVYFLDIRLHEHEVNTE